MDNLGAILEVILVLGFMVWLFCNERRHEAREKDLLNRLMAKNYHEYAVFEERKTIDKVFKASENLFETRDAYPVD